MSARFDDQAPNQMVRTYKCHVLHALDGAESVMLKHIVLISHANHGVRSKQEEVD
jgi:hypothetical protein